MTSGTTKTEQVKALQWLDNRLRLLDQTLLPACVHFVELRRWTEVVSAITSMRVRGAPAIGLAGAYAVALAAQEFKDLPFPVFNAKLAKAASEISKARPTAVNLSWAVSYVMKASQVGSNTEQVVKILISEAENLEHTELRANRAIGEEGSSLIPYGATVMTHCNSGALATAGYGTALGVIRTAWEKGNLKSVIATETRPLFQGARLTAWELVQIGIPTTLIVDSAAASVLEGGQVSAVIVGADRIAANGDVANKIGTYGLAILAKAHGVPFYVAATMNTVDRETPSGSHIVVEERPSEEVSSPMGVSTTPNGINIFNPAFDVTPASYVTAIVTEKGIFTHPYIESFAAGANRHG